MAHRKPTGAELHHMRGYKVRNPERTKPADKRRLGGKKRRLAKKPPGEPTP
jgi:hypothetical protein